MELYRIDLDNVKKLFIQALIEAKDKELSKLKSEDEIEWEFSEKFESSMNKLIKKNNHIQLSTRRTVRRGLLAAIIALIIVFTGLMSVSATRESIIEFVKKVFSNHNEITLSENSTLPVDRIETEYTLTDLPSGYNLEIYNNYDTSVFSVWKNENGDEIAFGQDVLSMKFDIDNEYNYQEFNINGYPAFYTEDNSGAFLTWTDGYYWFEINGPKNEIDYLKNAPEKIVEKN